MPRTHGSRLSPTSQAHTWANAARSIRQRDGTFPTGALNAPRHPSRPRGWGKGQLGKQPGPLPQAGPAKPLFSVAQDCSIQQAGALALQPTPGEPGRQQQQLSIPAPARKPEAQESSKQRPGRWPLLEDRWERRDPGCPGQLQGRERQGRLLHHAAAEAGRMEKDQERDLEGKECVWRAGSARELRIGGWARNWSPEPGPGYRTRGGGRGWGAKVEEKSARAEAKPKMEGGLSENQDGWGQSSWGNSNEKAGAAKERKIQIEEIETMEGWEICSEKKNEERKMHLELKIRYGGGESLERTWPRYNQRDREKK